MTAYQLSASRLRKLLKPCWLEAFGCLLRPAVRDDTLQQHPNEEGRYTLLVSVWLRRPTTAFSCITPDRVPMSLRNFS
jgi:hypothetical protein